MFARGSSTTGLVDSRKIHGWIHRRFNCSIASWIVGAKKYALEGAREGLSIASARANNEGAKAKITS